MSTDDIIHVDHVICATGYQVDMSRIPLLNRGNLLKRLKYSDGFPDLDNYFQSNIPGLFITSMPATKDFGLFFSFTVSALGSARLIGKFLSLEE